MCISYSSLIPSACCHFTIRQDMERERLRGEAGDAMEDVEEEDTVPEILPRHFEDAVRNARRSVSDRDLAQYSSFAQNLQQVRCIKCVFVCSCAVWGAWFVVLWVCVTCNIGLLFMNSM